MPPSSSTSSSRRRRGFVAAGLFACALAATFVVSAWRLEVHGLARTREERVVHGVTRMRGVEAEAILLADSVTAGPAFGATAAPDVHLFLTNGYLRLAGQYLLFRRFIEHNRTKRMFLFVHPTLFIYDVSDSEGGGYARYTYIDSVFTRPEEKRILAEGGASPEVRVESRFERLLKTWYPDHFPRPYSMDLFLVQPSKESPRADPSPRAVAPLTPQARYFLHRFEADCREHAIECSIVESPTPPGIRRYDMAELGRRFPGLRFIDVHDFAYYPAEAFPDGWHLAGAASDRYLAEIQAHVWPLFATGNPVWNGRKIDFNTPDASLLFAADSYHYVETWGAWSSAPVLAMRFRVSRDLGAGDFHVVAVTPPQPGGAAVPLSIWLDGEKMTEIVSKGPKPREIVFSTGSNALSVEKSHILELRLPHTVNLRALGMSSDPRDLGPGVVSIAFCRRGRCD